MKEGEGESSPGDEDGGDHPVVGAGDGQSRKPRHGEDQCRQRGAPGSLATGRDLRAEEARRRDVGGPRERHQGEREGGEKAEKGRQGEGLHKGAGRPAPTQDLAQQAIGDERSRRTNGEAQQHGRQGERHDEEKIDQEDQAA